MPKLRGKRHSWEKEGEYATCTNCGLKVATRLIKKGGLPTCDEVIESKSVETTLTGKLNAYYQEYIDSYHKGYDRYGMWWKLFTFSMLGFAAVFIAVAAILFVLYG
jgi:hypothetical protein